MATRARNCTHHEASAAKGAGGVIGALQAAGYPTERFVDAKGVIQGGSTGNFDADAYSNLLAKYPKP